MIWRWSLLLLLLNRRWVWRWEEGGAVVALHHERDALLVLGVVALLGVARAGVPLVVGILGGLFEVGGEDAALGVAPRGSVV